ncbi:HisI-like family-protein [Ranid herpesvirus 3]|uniref:HisI-like family-protein n=1 Tax=Ranid herpesvirus 3 TaxID=1987509 RepID=A0A1X9T5K6_9VIRU|nr:HisI-like family-protein [Ranid herpesvirus 3]ARR28989.1 HisI-like family-protein [Ranid herpesvirus 3]
MESRMKQYKKTMKVCYPIEDGMVASHLMVLSLEKAAQIERELFLHPIKTLGGRSDFLLLGLAYRGGQTYNRFLVYANLDNQEIFEVRTTDEKVYMEQVALSLEFYLSGKHNLASSSAHASHYGELPYNLVTSRDFAKEVERHWSRVVHETTGHKRAGVRKVGEQYPQNLAPQAAVVMKALLATSGLECSPHFLEAVHDLTRRHKGMAVSVFAQCPESSSILALCTADVVRAHVPSGMAFRPEEVWIGDMHLTCVGLIRTLITEHVIEPFCNYALLLVDAVGRCYCLSLTANKMYFAANSMKEVIDVSPCPYVLSSNVTPAPILSSRTGLNSAVCRTCHNGAEVCFFRITGVAAADGGWVQGTHDPSLVYFDPVFNSQRRTRPLVIPSMERATLARMVHYYDSEPEDDDMATTVFTFTDKICPEVISDNSNDSQDSTGAGPSGRYKRTRLV